MLVSALKSFLQKLTRSSQGVSASQDDLCELARAAARFVDENGCFDPAGLSGDFVRKYCNLSKNGRASLNSVAKNLFDRLDVDNRGNVIIK